MILYHDSYHCLYNDVIYLNKLYNILIVVVRTLKHVKNIVIDKLF